MSESQARKKSIFLSKHVPYDIVYNILTWLPMKSIMRFSCFYGCMDNGELLIEKADELVSFDPESLNENVLAIEATDWMGYNYTANSMDSLILLDGASISSDSMVLSDAASVSSE
uniref:F-box domain-containing protein n=1 Tax=Fagus sylvatica TaxID=28930 RepID=A0A2N9EFG7_FAGSY